LVYAVNQNCGGAMKVIVGAPNRCIEDHDVIQKILTHLQMNTKATAPCPLPEPRAPPISADQRTGATSVHALIRPAKVLECHSATAP
jgi:hypothetical protein